MGMEESAPSEQRLILTLRVKHWQKILIMDYGLLTDPTTSSLETKMEALQTLIILKAGAVSHEPARPMQ